MSAEKPRHSAEAIRDYLREWLSRQKRAADLVPDVQQAAEEADWQCNAWTAMHARAPEELRNDVDRRFELSYRQLQGSLPMPPDYNRTPFPTVTVTVTSGTMSAYGAALTMKDLRCIMPEEAAIHLESYRTLQETHDRPSAARNLLCELLPPVVTFFDNAHAAFQTAKSQPNQIGPAALEMRTLLDKVKGELFDRARELPSENMTWTEMAKRLGANAEAHEILEAQASDRQELYNRLSSVAKRRADFSIDALVSLWPLVLDHCVVVCSNVRRAT